MEYELSGEQASDDGQGPAHHLEDVPAEARVLVEEEGEAVAHHDDVSLGLAVRHGVLGEDEEVEEGDQVGHDEARPRVLEVVAEVGIYFHAAGHLLLTPAGATARQSHRSGSRSTGVAQSLARVGVGLIQTATVLRCTVIS